MPQVQRAVIAASEYTFTIPSDVESIPTAKGGQFLYWMDDQGNIYKPGQEYTIVRDENSSAVEIKELVAVWSKDEYATLINHQLKIYAGSRTDDEGHSIDGFIGNIPSPVNMRSIILGDTSKSSLGTYEEMLPWYNVREDVCEVTFDKSIGTEEHQQMMKTYNSFFKGMTSLIRVDVNNLRMDYCPEGVSIDFTDMFNGCVNLKNVLIDSERD